MSDRSLLESVARRAMQQYGLEPDFPAAALTEASSARAATPDGVRDLRSLLWSSIDNDESRDLDQLEVCDGGSSSATRVLVAIADVDAFVAQGDAVDRQDVAAARRRSRGDRHSARRRRRWPRPAVRRLSGHGAQSGEADVRRGGRVARRQRPGAG